MDSHDGQRDTDSALILEGIRALRNRLDELEHRHRTILKRAADRGEARADVETRIATLPTALFRSELFLARIPPLEGTLVEIVDDVFLPLVRPRPGAAGA